MATIAWPSARHPVRRPRRGAADPRRSGAPGWRPAVPPRGGTDGRPPGLPGSAEEDRSNLRRNQRADLDARAVFETRATPGDLLGLGQVVGEEGDVAADDLLRLHKGAIGEFGSAQDLA